MRDIKTSLATARNINSIKLISPVALDPGAASRRESRLSDIIDQKLDRLESR